MKNPLGITTFLCLAPLAWSGCAPPCHPVPDKSCDWHDPNNKCRFVCENGEQADGPGEGEAAQEPDAPSNDHGQAGGQPSDGDD